MRLTAQTGGEPRHSTLQRAVHAHLTSTTAWDITAGIFGSHGVRGGTRGCDVQLGEEIVPYHLVNAAR